MKTHSLALALGGALAAAAAAMPAQAQVIVGVHASTAGFGPDAQLKLNDNLTVRGAGDWLNFSYGRTYDNVHYDGRLKLATAGAFLDYHPWASAFLVSAGAYFGDRRVDISARPSGTVTLGGQTFTAAQAGRLDGKIKMASAAPFAGFGFDNSTDPDHMGLGFKALLGVAFGGKPSVSLASTGGSLSGTPALQSALAQEQANIANKGGVLQYYPVASLGLNYRF
jgi:hypothetical protein